MEKKNRLKRNKGKQREELVIRNKLKKDEGRVHLRVLLSIIFFEQLSKGQVKPETLNVSQYDISVLNQIMFPGAIFWDCPSNSGCDLIYPFYRDLAKRMRTIILKQHPDLAHIAIDKLTDDNFKTWLKQQIKKFGEWFIIKRKK